MVKHGLRTRGLCGQRAKGRNVIVALDQRRHRSAPRDRSPVERPYRFRDGRTVGVDQEPPIFVVTVFGETGKMDLPGPMEREGVDIGHMLETVVNGSDVHIVDIEQEPASSALRDLAQKCADREVRLAQLADLDDEAVIEQLIPVRGIGRWTAEMFLIFGLGRLDVMPVADYGLRAGMKREHSLAELPNRQTLLELTEAWRPYRSIGTWYIWRSFGAVPQSK